MYFFSGPQGNIGRHKEVGWLGQGIVLAWWSAVLVIFFLFYTLILFELFSSEQVLHL